MLAGMVCHVERLRQRFNVEAAKRSGVETSHDTPANPVWVIAMGFAQRPPEATPKHVPDMIR